MKRRVILLGILLVALVGAAILVSSLSPAQAYGSESVLLTNVCNTAIWESAGGIALKEGTLKAGQTWFVTKDAKVDSKGNYWAEVYITSRITVYVPASCFPGIGGLPTVVPTARVNTRSSSRAQATSTPVLSAGGTGSTGGSSGSSAPVEAPPVFEATVVIGSTRP
jgi:hypothetical protein